MTQFLDKLICRLYTLNMKKTLSIGAGDMTKAVAEIRAVTMTAVEKSTMLAKIFAEKEGKPVASVSPIQSMLVTA
jgi:hypothetical protein